MGRLIPALVIVVAGAACSKDSNPSGPDSGGGTRVTASAANVFSPSVLDITVGTTVTWVFGPVDHTVTFAAVAGAPASIDLSHNKSVSRTFTTAGTFAYVCTVHPGMAGQVRVTQPITSY
jgi:plastocyanin